MQTVIDPTGCGDQLIAPPLLRRHALAWLAGLGGWALPPGQAQAVPAGRNALRSQPRDTATLAAAWETQGSFHIGWVSLAPGRGSAAEPAPLGVLASLEVPSRAHGLCPLPDGSILAVARRPGDWLVRWRPGSKAPPQWLWQASDTQFPDRTFNGHALRGLDGRYLYTTETDVETGESVIGLRDIRTLHKLAEWPTHGLDAHELIWDTNSPGGPTLIVANGGVPTAPETGRAKRDLDRMDSSLVRLHGTTGRLLGQWRLPDQRLSLRHLAWSAGGAALGIALQAEHDDPGLRHAAPVFALFDGQALQLAADAPRATDTALLLRRDLQGYGGSIVGTPQGWAVSCPRAGCVAFFDDQGHPTGHIDLSEVCALAASGAHLYAGGAGQSVAWDGAVGQNSVHAHTGAFQNARLDNHWAWAAPR